MKGIVLILALFGMASLVSGQELSEAAKKVAQKALTCSEQQDYDCALKTWETLIADYNLTNQQVSLVKTVYKNDVYDYAEKKISNDDTYKLEPLLKKGISLCNDLDERYTISSLVFHVWLTGYYAYTNNTEKDRWVNKLKHIRDNIEESDPELEREMVAWANKIIRYSENPHSGSSSSSYSLNWGALFSGSSEGSSQTSSNNTRSNESKNNSERETKGRYEYIKERKFSDHIEYTYKCESGKYFIVRKFLASGQVYSSSGTKYNSVNEAARKWAEANCR